MIRHKYLNCLFICLCAGYISCGVDEYYYLPQIPEGSISRDLNTEAVIVIPPIPDQYYYANFYTIYYRIYVSNHLTTSVSELAQISPALLSDYNLFFPITNPANTTAITMANTFSNRNYFRLEFEGTSIANVLPPGGGTLRIQFPTAQWGIPVVSLNDGQQFRIIRSSELSSPEPRGDLLFRNTPELRDNANANANTNADVAGRAGIMQYAYVSMYIVAVGTDPANFSAIYSKPTHISVFKLPDTH